MKKEEEEEKKKEEKKKEEEVEVEEGNSKEYIQLDYKIKDDD